MKEVVCSCDGMDWPWVARERSKRVKATHTHTHKTPRTTRFGESGSSGGGEKLVGLLLCGAG